MKNKELVEKYYSEVIGLGDYSNLAELISSEYIDHNSPDSGAGPEVVKNHMSAIRTTFPDFEVEIQNIIVEGQFVVTQVNGKGTHQGEWMGIKPSNNTIFLKGINIDRIENGKIVEHWGEADTIGMLMQMGINPFENKEE